MSELSLDDLCIFVNGGAWSEAEYVSSGHPVLKVSNIKGSSVDVDNLSYLSDEGLKKYERNVLQENDLVIATVGSHQGLVQSAAGRTIVIRKNIAGYLLNQNAACLRTKRPDLLDQRYLGYMGESELFKNYIQVRGRGAANQMRIAVGEIKKFVPVLPSLPIQQKIARILSAYDVLIENNLKRIKLLEEMAQITYEQWFVHLRFPGHDSTPINPETGLPEGWLLATMQDLFDFKNGYAFKSGSYVQDGQHKIVTIKNVQDGSFIPDTTDTIAELPSNIKAHHQLSTGDIIMSLTGNVGRVCLFYGENYLLNQRVAKIVPNNPADHLYVYTLLRSRGTLTQLENISNGAAQQNLSPVNASKIPALVPTRTVLNDFNKSIGGIIDLICLKNIENQRLREARDILLPRLMTGVIDVESYNPSQFLKDAA